MPGVVNDRDAAAKGEALITEKPRVSLESMHFSRTFARITGCVHLHVLLGEAAVVVRFEEGSVAALQNIHFGIADLRIAVHVYLTIHISQMQCHSRCSLRRILAVKDDDG